MYGMMPACHSQGIQPAGSKRRPLARTVCFLRTPQGRDLSYAALREQSGRIASALSQRGALPATASPSKSTSPRKRSCSMRPACGWCRICAHQRCEHAQRSRVFSARFAAGAWRGSAARRKFRRAAGERVGHGARDAGRETGMGHCSAWPPSPSSDCNFQRCLIGFDRCDQSTPPKRLKREC